MPRIEPKALKYPTLASLKAAYDSGEIEREDPLWLDNDTASVYVGEENERVYECYPDKILTEALDLLGIPHDHV
jgi:hypothetical protein